MSDWDFESRHDGLRDPLPTPSDATVEAWFAIIENVTKWWEHHTAPGVVTPITVDDFDRADEALTHLREWIAEAKGGAAP